MQQAKKIILVFLLRDLSTVFDFWVRRLLLAHSNKDWLISAIVSTVWVVFVRFCRFKRTGRESHCFALDIDIDQNHSFKPAEVSTLHDGWKQGIDQQIFNRKSISRKITHPQSWKLHAKLTGEKVQQRKKQTQDYNQNIVTQAQKSQQLNKLTDITNTSCDKKKLWLIK